MNFCIVDNHKGKTIGKMVESCLEEWNIVTDGLKHHNKSIDRVCHAVRYVKAPPNRLQTFKKCVEKVKIESKAIYVWMWPIDETLPIKCWKMLKSLNMHQADRI